MSSFWCGPALAQNVGACYNQATKWARIVLEGAEKARLSGADDKWQLDSPYKEEFELLRHSKDLRLDGSLIRQAFYVGKSRNWTKVLGM